MFATHLNINVVSDFVYTHVSRQVDHAVISELAREHVAGSAAVTVCSSHDGCCFASNLRVNERENRN